MHFSTLLMAGFLSLLTSALPLTERWNTYQDGDKCGMTNFYLVATDSVKPINSSLKYPRVKALTVFAPNYQTDQILRVTGPGYNELPTFNLTGGQLRTLSMPAHSIQYEVFNSTKLAVNSTLTFTPKPAPAGQWQFELVEGYLLNTANQPKVGSGFSLCPGPLGYPVVKIYGSGIGCEYTYLQAVKVPPY